MIIIKEKVVEREQCCYFHTRSELTSTSGLVSDSPS